jgi:hypothetical protein
VLDTENVRMIEASCFHGKAVSLNWGKLDSAPSIPSFAHLPSTLVATIHFPPSLYFLSIQHHQVTQINSHQTRNPFSTVIVLFNLGAPDALRYTTFLSRCAAPPPATQQGPTFGAVRNIYFQTDRRDCGCTDSTSSLRSF